MPEETATSIDFSNWHLSGWNDNINQEKMNTPGFMRAMDDFSVNIDDYSPDYETIPTPVIRTCTWNQVTPTEAGQTITYHLQVEFIGESRIDDPPFEDLILDNEDIADSSGTVSQDVSLDRKGFFCWRVRCFDSLDYGNWSQVSWFEVV